MLLALSQPVNCIFWPIETLNWLVAASKLHKHRRTCYTVEWPYCPFAILWKIPDSYDMGESRLKRHARTYKLHLSGFTVHSLYCGLISDTMFIIIIIIMPMAPARGGGKRGQLPPPMCSRGGNCPPMCFWTCRS